VNVLEQALLSVDPIRQSRLRTNLIQLAKFEADEPGAIDGLVKEMEAKRNAAERWRGNQELGKIVEELIEAVLEEEFRDQNLKVQSNFCGLRSEVVHRWVCPS
jgi:hypothetical protein